MRNRPQHKKVGSTWYEVQAMQWWNQLPMRTKRYLSKQCNCIGRERIAKYWLNAIAIPPTEQS